MNQEEPSSASKIVKIAHQQTLGLLLFNYYCFVFELLLSDLSSDFYLYLEHRTPIQARLVSLES
jgi:hypothetical protein